MTAGIYNLTIEQGANFSRTITWLDADGIELDLSDYMARAQFRTSHTASTTVFELTTENSGIVLGGAAGTIALVSSAASTAVLTAPSYGVWDLELIDASGNVTRLLEGRYSITPEVTR